MLICRWLYLMKNDSLTMIDSTRTDAQRHLSFSSFILYQNKLLKIFWAFPSFDHQFCKFLMAFGFWLLSTENSTRTGTRTRGMSDEKWLRDRRFQPHQFYQRGQSFKHFMVILYDLTINNVIVHCLLDSLLNHLQSRIPQ